MRLLLALGLLLPLAAHAERGGAVVVVSFTEGAEILVDGKPVGSVPHDAAIPVTAGMHVVALKKLGFLPFEQKVAVGAGKTVEVEADLLAVAGGLKVTSTPSGAPVFIDGTEHCKTPCALEATVGQRTVEVRLAGYAVHREQFVVAAGNLYVVEAALTELDVPEPDLMSLMPAATPVIAPDSEAPAVSTPIASAPPPIEQSELRRVVERESWYEQWYVWAGLGLVATAVVTTVLLLPGNGGEDRPVPENEYCYMRSIDDPCVPGNASGLLRF